MFKKGKKGQNIWKFGQKCTKLENTLKKGRWLRVIITHNKLLEKALACYRILPATTRGPKSYIRFSYKIFQGICNFLDPNINFSSN